MFGTAQINQTFAALRRARALDTWRGAGGLVAAADVSALPSTVAA